MAYNFPMRWPRVFGVVAIVGTLCLTVAAQEPAPESPSGRQSSSSSGKAAPVQNDQEPPADQTGSSNGSGDSKHDSKLKKLKDAAPNCIGFEGGTGKCRHPQESEEDAKKESEDRKLRQRCQDDADQAKPEIPSCADLRKSDAAHDVAVGDDYFQEKHYPSAENRYRLALQEDPKNATAMLHLSEVLEKSGKNSEAYEQYQDFLNTDPQGPDQKKAQAALQRLRPYWTGTPAAK